MNIQEKSYGSQIKTTAVSSKHPIVGSWRLLSCKHLHADGVVEYPFGHHPKGRLVYLPDGKMIVLITGSARLRFRSDQFFEADNDELANAARGCVAYSGRWRILGNKVVHDIDQSLFPNWVRQSLARAFQIDGGRLILTTAPFVIRGIEQTASLVWRSEV